MLQRLAVDVNGGLLTLIDDHGTSTFDDDFDVDLALDIRTVLRQSRERIFDGVLSHQPLIPTIGGYLTPTP